jgi:hypothetical protein
MDSLIICTSFSREETTHMWQKFSSVEVPTASGTFPPLMCVLDTEMYRLLLSRQYKLYKCGHATFNGCTTNWGFVLVLSIATREV